jgi:acyl-CoA hydrolase
MDEARKPIAVTPFEPSTDAEKRRHAAAGVRKKLRQEFALQMQAGKALQREKKV